MRDLTESQSALQPRPAGLPEAPAVARLDSPPAAGNVMLLQYRLRTLRFAALLVAASYAIDWFQPRFAEVALVRALWIGALLVTASLQRTDRPRLATFGSYLCSIATGFAVVAIVALDGGTASIFQGMLLATPFAVLVAMAELPLAAALNGAICVAGGTAIRIAEGQPGVQVASWLLLSSVMSALATWGTVAARYAWRAEVAAEKARLKAQEALAESERQRAAGEQLAEVGRLAARVAHEVNNPLAVVKANVQWLGTSAETEDAQERHEVVADTLASVERIVDAVSSVRKSAGERPFSSR